MIRLHWFPGTCSRVVLIALEEIGEPFETELHAWFDEEWTAYRRDVNPKGQVPTLEIDGRLLTEVPAIVTLLDRLHPEAGLLPTGDAAIDALSTMCWFSSGVHTAISRVRFPMYTCDAPGAEERVRAMALESIASSLAIVEDRLGDREWLMEGRWTILDGFLLWLWFRAVGSGLDGAPFPRIAAHAHRCQRRPSVVRALDREEATFAELEMPAGWPPNQVGRVPA